MADFAVPVVTTGYVNVLSNLKDRDIDAITICLNDPTNTPVGAIKYNRVSDKFQEWSGTAWVDKVLSIAAGGTGAVTAATARTALGLGTMAVQNANGVAITGGSMSGVGLNGSDITSGLIAQARLGSGSTGAGTLFLADDQTYKATVAVQPGTGFMWFTTVAPGGYLLCDGSAVSRATYSVLFGIIGTTYGAGDGVTTFNVPDLRQRFPLGLAAAGTGNALGATGGAIDHVHTGPSHTHTGPAHTHTVNSHTHVVTDHVHGGTGHTHTFTTGDANLSATTTDGTTASHFDLAIHFHQHSGTTDSGGAVNSQGIFPFGTPVNSGAASPVTDSQGTGATGASGTGNTSSNNPPYLVVNYIVKT